MRGKYALADHMTTAWQAKFHDGMKWFRKVQTYGLQANVKISLCINTESD
jgi:hypothetical protein